MNESRPVILAHISKYNSVFILNSYFRALPLNTAFKVHLQTHKSSAQLWPKCAPTTLLAATISINNFMVALCVS